VVLAALAGCSGERKAYPISGTVTYDGRPVPAGVVWFDPDSSKGTKGPQGFAYIQDGVFDTEGEGHRKGRGVYGGAYVVRVEGFDGRPGKELPLGKPLFTDFREARDLPEGPAQLEIVVPKQ